MRKQQRLSPVVGIGLDRTEENHMVAAIISIGCAALKVCNAIRKNRSVAKARRPLNPGKLVLRRFCESARKRLLRCAKDIDCKMAGVLEYAHALRKDPQAPEYERRIQRHRRERIAGQPVGLPVSRGSRDNGNVGGKRAQRVTKIPRIDWRVITGQFVSWVWIDRMLWRVGHPAASKRQVFGWQAKRNAAVVGAGRIEIERDVRINRVRIAKLPL